MSHLRLLTAVADGHTHTWEKGELFTSHDAGPKHRIQGVIAMPASMGGHSHLLLNIPEKQRNIGG